MKRLFVLKSHDIKADAATCIMTLNEPEDHEVIIRPHKKDRSVAQNSLMWLWITRICESSGDTKDWMHREFKRLFLVRIYERDDIEYAAMINSVRKVYSIGMKKEAQQMFDQITELTSTTRATVEQFTEYLNDIESHARDKYKVVLPHPEDRYYEAMGVKK